MMPVANRRRDQASQRSLLRAQSGDRDALDDLLQGCQVQLYRYLSILLEDPLDAEDAVQMTFLQVCRKLRSLSDPANFMCRREFAGDPVLRLRDAWSTVCVLRSLPSRTYDWNNRLRAANGIIQLVSEITPWFQTIDINKDCTSTVSMHQKFGDSCGSVWHIRASIANEKHRLLLKRRKQQTFNDSKVP
jgi:hypothetical protein